MYMYIYVCVYIYLSGVNERYLSPACLKLFSFLIIVCKKLEQKSIFRQLIVMEFYGQITKILKMGNIDEKTNLFPLASANS